MDRNGMIKVLTKYGYSNAKALEISIDAERGLAYAKTALSVAMQST